MHRHLKLGLLALPLSAWAVVLPLPWRGEFQYPGSAGWDAWVQSSGFTIWSSAALNATVWLAFGLIALYMAMPGMHGQLRFYGTAWALAGTLVWLPIVGIVAIGWPNMSADTASAIMNDPTFNVWSIFATAASVLGFILLAGGFWLGGERVTAVLFGLGTLSFIPSTPILEILAGGALAAGFTRLAWHAWAPVPTAPTEQSWQP